tara:strand:+ start:185 stop:967 length:783 start_codon:yes stop_codon:yes gene_type:complete
LANGCGEVQPLTGQEHPETINVKVGDAFKMNIYLDADTETPPETVGPDPGEVEPTDIEELPEMGTEESCQAPYPGGPFSLEKFGIIDNMTFYDPWRDNWIELSDFYLHENYKALLLVSSAGWCGPCLSEASSLIGLYDKYHEDGLEIVYTLGNTNTPGDVPFDTSAGDTGSPDFYNDIGFMENWQNMASDGADKMINYRMYADPKREFLEYFPGHAWPLSVLVTTKDMGIRLVEEGYWSTLMENKIQLVLWNDVPNLPFE